MKFWKKKDSGKKDLLNVPGQQSYPAYLQGGGPGRGDQNSRSAAFVSRPSWASPRILATLPEGILERIFAYVCPHTRDESYETCESSAPDNACMLCDLRDLAHCAQVTKKWRASAIRLIYYSIRIDAVHYCELEAVLAERRKRRSFLNRNAEPEDTSTARLKLLCRTLREDPTRLGALVRFFKTPYMLRESGQADLARTIAVLPHLLYVDLPVGLFSDEPTFATLKLEVQARCPNLRKMAYYGGAERSLEMLAHGTIWRNLEVLELKQINMDPTVLRHVLGTLGNLHALKVTETSSFSDIIFAYNDMLPPFPSLTEFILTKTPKVTLAGMVDYLSRTETRRALKVLTLSKTGVNPSRLQEIVGVATALKTLAIDSTVSIAFPNANTTPLLSSRSLQTLRYEISANETAGPYSGVVSSYSTYLASSLFANGLPNLRAVYVRDEDFEDMLQGLPPPNGGFGGTYGGRPSSSSSTSSFPYISPPNSGGFPPARPRASHVPPSQRFSSNNPFAANSIPTHALEVYHKRDDQMTWSSVKRLPSRRIGGHSRQVTGMSLVAPQQQQRPVSSYGLGADIVGQGWTAGGARRSVMVGNGAGAFMALPEQDPGPPPVPWGEDGRWPRPLSSAGEKRRGDKGLWGDI